MSGFRSAQGFRLAGASPSSVASSVVTPGSLTPLAPITGSIALAAIPGPNRPSLVQVEAGGQRRVLGPHLGLQQCEIAIPTGISFSALGTGISTLGVAAAAFNQQQRMVQLTSSAAAGSASGVWSQLLPYKAAQGFYVAFQVGWTDAVDANMFFGLSASAASPTDQDPAGLTQSVGIGRTHGDAFWAAYSAAGAVQTRHATGVGFDSTKLHLIELYANRSTGIINWQITRLGNAADPTNNGVFDVTSGVFTTAVPTSALGLWGWRSNNAIAASVVPQFGTIYAEQYPI